MIHLQYFEVVTQTNDDELRTWLINCVKDLGLNDYTLSYVFVNDEYLLDLNQKSLGHETYTDILTFDLSENSGPLNAEIYISYDRVEENSETFDCTFEQELRRVMIHGILHLLGYDDDSEPGIARMREMENKYIKF